MAESKATEAKAYVVLHTMVGVHRAGDVITFAKDDIEKAGVSVERLLRLGAIREADKDEAKSAVSYGETDEDTPRVFPAVPFQNVGTSPDPNRRESPPTLPQEGMPNEATPVGGKVSDAPKPAKA